MKINTGLLYKIITRIIEITYVENFQENSAMQSISSITTKF